MYQTSSNFRAWFNASGSQIYKVVVKFSNGAEIATDQMPDFLDGTVNIQSGAIRRKCTISFKTQTPSKDWLRVINDTHAQWFVYAGVNIKGVEEWIPQGVFYMKDLPIDEPGSYVTYRLSLQDASLPIGERKTTKACTYSGDLTEIVQAIIKNTGWETIFKVQLTGVSASNYMVDIDKDPWQVCQNLLEGVGYEIFFNIYGHCVIQPLDDVVANALKAIDLTTSVLSKQSTLSRRAVNHIIVLSTNNAQGAVPVKGEAFDKDPSSPAYYDGGYGDVPKTFKTSGLGSNAQADIVAENLGKFWFRRSESVMFSILSYPAFEINDAFMVGDDVYLADQISIPLTTTRPMYLTSHKGPSNG